MPLHALYKDTETGTLHNLWKRSDGVGFAECGQRVEKPEFVKARLIGNSQACRECERIMIERSMNPPQMRVRN